MKERGTLRLNSPPATTREKQRTTAPVVANGLRAVVPPKTKSEDANRVKRISFYLPESLYDDLRNFADERGDSVTGVLRWSLGAGKAVWDEIKEGQKIFVISEGESRKELVFSRY